MPGTPVTFSEVEVTRHTSVGFYCCVEGKEIFVGGLVPLDGTTVRLKGDRGNLVVPRWFAEHQGLRVPDYGPP